MMLAIYLNSEYYQTKPTCCLNRWKLVKNLYSNMLRIQFCYKLWSMTYESSPSGMDGSYFERLSFTFKTQHLPLYDVLICWDFRKKLFPSFNNIPCFLSFLLTRTYILITLHFISWGEYSGYYYFLNLLSSGLPALLLFFTPEALRVLSDLRRSPLCTWRAEK